MAVPSTHILYGGGGGEFVADTAEGTPPLLKLAPAAVLTAWPARTGGTQVTDLYDLSENPVTTIVADGFGNYRVFAPQSVGTLWVSTDGGTTRYAVQPADLGATVVALAADVVVALGVAQEAAQDASDAQQAAAASAASAAAAQVAAQQALAAASSLVAGAIRLTNGLGMPWVAAYDDEDVAAAGLDRPSLIVALERNVPS